MENLRPRPLRFLAALTLGLAFTLGLTSCGHYQVGTQSKLSFTTLYLAPVENTSGLPQVVALISTQLREKFLRDPRIQLVADPAAAQAILEVKLLRHTREPTSKRSEPDDTGLARKFDLTLHAEITLRDTRNATALISARPLSATRQLYTTDGTTGAPSDQLAAEYQTLSLIAETLATRIASSVLDTW